MIRIRDLIFYGCSLLFVLLQLLVVKNKGLEGFVFLPITFFMIFIFKSVTDVEWLFRILKFIEKHW